MRPNFKNARLRISFGLAVWLTLVLLQLSNPPLAWAHDHRLTTWELQPKDDGSLQLKVQFAQESAHRALFARHGRENILGIPRDRYEQLVVEYMRSATRLTTSSGKVPFTVSKTAITNHSSSLVFSIAANNATNEAALSLELLPFADQTGQRHLVRFVDENGEELSRVVLRAPTGFRTSWSPAGKSLNAISGAPQSPRHGLAWSVLVALMIAAGAAVTQELRD